MGSCKGWSPEAVPISCNCTICAVRLPEDGGNAVAAADATTPPRLSTMRTMAGLFMPFNPVERL